MTKEEKQLVLQDICARLPYGLRVRIYNHWTDSFEDETLSIDNIGEILQHFPIEDIKPYLRPMSSMTEEERDEIEEMSHGWFYVNEDGEIFPIGQFSDSGEFEDAILPTLEWLNKNGFDYHGLIHIGLALEVSEGMYNKEEPEKGSGIPIPKTVDEAVKTLAKILSKEDRNYLIENGAISMHDSLGRWIRNEWGLWAGSELKDELTNMNKGLNHPDDMSNYIIEEFIKYWNNKI